MVWLAASWVGVRMRIRTRLAVALAIWRAMRTIQRLETVGGRAPAGGCTQDTLTKVARVPYKATYYFYRAG